ncbi:MAG: hypothetical protein GX366_01970 [Epulopiscium sp.]|nr:hypothetical protein [Candidatus Epulonipiscium sp.]
MRTSVSQSYNQYLMSNFLDVFSYDLPGKGRERDVFLLKNFIPNSNLSPAPKSNNFLSFQRTCKNLVVTGNYSYIMNFMIAIHSYGDLYDLEKIHERLAMITLPNGKDLSHMSTEFYARIEGQETEFGLPIISSPKLIVQELASFTCSYILGYDWDLDDLSTELIDKIVLGSINIKKQQQSENHETTDFEQEILVPGILLELYKLCHLNGQTELCNYIHYTYIWPVFSKVPWKEGERPEVKYMTFLVKSYMEWMYDLLLNHPTYTDSISLEDLVADNKIKLTDLAPEFDRNTLTFSLQMAQTFSEGNFLIKEILPTYLYSFSLSFIPYLLYCGGYVKECIDFLIRYYDEISPYDKRKIRTQYVLINAILHSQRIEEATILYGYFNYEMDRQERERESHIETIEEIIEYLLDAKNYLANHNDFRPPGQPTLEDIVFGNGEIISTINAAQQSISKNIIPSKSVFMQLMLYVRALAHPSGIRLKMLGLGKVNGDDTLGNALPLEYYYRGHAFINQCDENLSYYDSLYYLESRSFINIFIQDYIYHLMDQIISDSTETLENLRNNAPEVGNLISSYNQIIHNLSTRLSTHYIGREEVENKLLTLQKDFIDKYNLDVKSFDLISLLPRHIQGDCRNYLVTSEIVFKVLSDRDDRDQVDFSAALISLTKAMEKILNDIYQQMDIKIYPGIDSKTKHTYFKKIEPYLLKYDSIAFGPCIYLLSDGKFINYNEKSGDFTWGSRYLWKKSRFNYWGGNQILDFSRLSQLRGLEIPFETKGKNRKLIKRVASFSNNQEYNRMLFIKGLEYIKDNFRNVVAHQNSISLDTFVEARSFLIQTEEMLWVLIYLLK